MDQDTATLDEKKGLWDRAKEAKDSIIERLKGAEQTALEAIEKVQVEVLTEMRAAGESIGPSIEKIADSVQQAQDLVTRSEESSTLIKNLELEAKKAVELTQAKSEEVKTSQTQIQSLLKVVETSDADAKAHLKEIVSTKAEMKNQFSGINQFYSEIGERKNELLTLKNNTATDLSKLNEDFSTTLEEHKARTETLVLQNEKIGQEIKSHLQRAVGASLFSAFGTRKDKIIFGKWIWFGALFLSFVGGFLWVNFMIKELKTSIDAAFIVRTIFGVLIGGFIYFCSKQYDRERKAEEEYAFKAAISVSLKPFHDLLIESKNKEIDDEFMKDLMKEIFENPVDRLFLEGKSVSKIEINRQGVSGEVSNDPSAQK